MISNNLNAEPKIAFSHKHLNKNHAPSIQSSRSLNKNSTSARTVLWYLVFFGFAINYMIRINLNIAIVDMTSSNKKTIEKNHMTECTNNQSSAELKIDLNNNVINTTVISDIEKNENKLNQTGTAGAQPFQNAITKRKLNENSSTIRKRYSMERLILDYFQVRIFN